MKMLIFTRYRLYRSQTICPLGHTDKVDILI